LNDTLQSKEGSRFSHRDTDQLGSDACNSAHRSQPHNTKARGPHAVTYLQHSNSMPLSTTLGAKIHAHCRQPRWEPYSKVFRLPYAPSLGGPFCILEPQSGPFRKRNFAGSAPKTLSSQRQGVSLDALVNEQSECRYQC
jgi:hypothetical protein